MIPHPPQIGDYAITQSKRLRFTTSAAIAQEITYQNLLDCVLFTTSAIAPFTLFNQVRVKNVKVWALPVVGSSSSVMVIFNGATLGTTGDRVVHQDSSMGIEPAFVTARPRTKTLASMFQTNSSANAFYLNCPINSVVDVSLDFRSDALGNAAPAQNASVGATPGEVAFRGLDGLAAATSKFTIPSGLVQI